MRTAILFALLFCAASSVVAQTKAAPAAPPSYDGEAVVVEQSETAVRYNADGTGEKSLHVRVKIQNEAGARPFSILSFPFASANETVQIQTLRVLHSDGTSTETPAADAMEMPAPVTQQAPLYSDLKVQQIPVRGLRSGDTLEYRVRIQRKNAESPSHFWDTFSFLKDVVVLAQTLTLDVPAAKYVQVWSPNHKPVVNENAGRRVYQWSDSQLKPTPSKKKDDDPAAPPADTKPEVAWTTFHNWQEVGDWYRTLAAPRAVATDALRAQADEITRQATTPEEQVRALYSFVATRIRYVGIDLGIGRYQPHAATEVLANQYGDCKDKDTLLEALLHAKGFTAAPALIGAGIDMVPELPSPSLFNHVITLVTLPSGKLWMDTTADIAPFQLLLAPLRDKDALVVPPSGLAALERTPAKTPFPFIDRFEAVATLKADGVLKGHVEINSRSDNELLLRTIARTLAPAQWDQGTQYFANLLGFSGKTSNSTFSRADDTSAPMHVSYDYERKPFGDWDNFRIVPLFPTNFLPAAPEKQPSEEIDLGALRTETSISRIRLPENFGADLPDAIHVKTSFATFDKTYKLEAGELIAEKSLVVLQSKLPAASWQQYKKFEKDTSLGLEAWVQLTTKSAIGNGPHPPKPGHNNSAAAELISAANLLEKSGDWVAVLKKLDEAKKIQPEQPFLWSNYGYVAMRQGKSEEARKHFRHELELHPDESFVVLLYAGYLHGLHEDQEARTVLTSFFNSDPSEPRIALMLAMLQADGSLPDAITTLRRASEASPKDHMIQYALGDYLIRNQQPTEAAALAKKQLEGGADDPEALNSAAYLLAQAKADLPVAEQSARKALELLEASTANSSVSEANEQSFRRTASLIATWDTLGYILLEQNKLEEARDYLEAAWLNKTDRVVGDHYAQLQEALGDPKAALRTYELARSASEFGSASPATSHIDASIARLKKAGVVSTVNGNAIQILQEQRSYKVDLKSAHGTYHSATFRLQMAAGLTEAVMRVSGEPSLEAATRSIKQQALPHLVPTHSTARILRDGVLSCSPGQSNCLFVLMPIGSINAERVEE